MTLDKLPIGKEATILSVDAEKELRLRLLDMGLTPNTKVRVLKKAPLGDPIEIFLRNYSLSIRLENAKSISVSE